MPISLSEPGFSTVPFSPGGAGLSFHLPGFIPKFQNGLIKEPLDWKTPENAQGVLYVA